MRKSLAGMLALLVAAAILLCGAAVEIGGRGDDVQLTETVLYGDASAAAGTRFTVSASCDDTLYWDTTYTVGAPEQTTTQFEYHNGQQRMDLGSTGYVEFYSAMLFGMSSNRDIFADDNICIKEDYLAPARDVASRCAAGQERTEVVRLEDYYDTIPLEFDVNLPNMESRGFTEEMKRQAMDNFRIPVPQDYRLEVTVEKNAAGETVSVNCNSADGQDGMYFYSYSVVTNEACYILVADDFSRGASLDFSQLKEGYGIYILPIQTLESGKVLPDVSGMGNVYPMTAGEAEICSLEQSADGENLLLYTKEEGAFYLTVIEKDSMRTAQKLKIAPLYSEHIAQIYDCDSFIVVVQNQGRTQVLQKTADGYVTALEADFSQCQEFLVNLNTYSVFVYDGTTLKGLTCIDPYGSSGVCLALWNEQGLCYAGRYDSSLNIADGRTDQGGLYRVRADLVPPLTLHG